MKSSDSGKGVLQNPVPCEEAASDPFASAVKGLAVHAGLEKKKPAKELVQFFGWRV